MSEVVELAKRRGFLYPSFEIYGGVAGFWDYGPLGARLKKKILDSWRNIYVIREGFEEIDTPTIGKETVFEASGHASSFSDYLIRCECGESHRADHRIEAETEIENADGLSKEELSNIIEEEKINCTQCGKRLEGDVEDFNLMFETQIGPSGNRRGFLRPETAQGIFIDFKRLKRYYREKIPFGVSQIGKSYRNEINPKQAVVRLREFEQAEVEFFKHPDYEKSLGDLTSVDVRLYPIDEQRKDEENILSLKVGEAVEKGIIQSETIAYFIARSQQWYESIGIDPSRFRFRQHLPDERAHYATDCWDGEALTEYGWIELNGIADRGMYDLTKHRDYSGEEFSVFEEYDETVVKEEATVDPDMSFLGPKFGGKAEKIARELEKLAEKDPEAFNSDEIELEIDGEKVNIEKEITGFEKKQVRKTGENVMPQVIEPSYGIDRIVYTVLEHSYDTDIVDEEERKVLRIPAEMSPIDVAVLPLVSKDGLDEKARQIENMLRDAGFMVKYDDSGAIGRRYRRQDEIGTPFAVTIDYDTLEDDTVTVRYRDTTQQERVDRENLIEMINEAKEFN